MNFILLLNQTANITLLLNKKLHKTRVQENLLQGILIVDNRQLS